METETKYFCQKIHAEVSLELVESQIYIYIYIYIYFTLYFKVLNETGQLII